MRRPWSSASTAFAALAAIAVARWLAGEAWSAGFPLDDAWIHMVYGRSLATHATLAYNDGVAATGCTSPLWAACVALAHLTSSPAACVKLLGLLFHGASAALVAELAPRRSFGAIVAVAVVAVAPIGAFGAVSGMEPPLTTAIMLGAFLAAVRARPRIACSLAGLAVLARPEAVVVVPFVAFLALRGATSRERLAGVSLAILPAALYAVRDVLVSGRPLPSTFYAKAHAPAFDRLDVHARLVFGEIFGAKEPYGRVAFVALVVAAIVLGVRRFREPVAILAACAATAAVLWIVGVFLTAGRPLVGLYYYERYYAPALPLAALAIAHPLDVLLARVQRPALAIAGGALAWSLLIVPPVLALPPARTTYVEATAIIDEVQVAIGHRLAGEAGDVVWSQDAGAPRYFGGKTTIDLNRLNTPDLEHAPAPALLVSSRWAIAIRGQVQAIAEYQPAELRERQTVQQIYRCIPGGTFALFVREQKLVSARCAD